MAERPSASARLRFAWTIGIIIITYGVLAIALSVHVIGQQSSARTDLYVTLQALDQLHREALSQAPTDQERQAIEAAWHNERAFAAASPLQAWHVVQTLISRLNREYPGNACGRNGPSFVTADTLPAQHACMVAMRVKGDVVQATGYDTQGIAMDNFYEYLYAPVGRSG
ncbi:hypothetical protein [Acidithiobacillus ferrivorans]|uniref:hypothetical protein n=1 Tax=Acidithiobacillus ferrivorans TaxID=160808 RepID=UPI001C07D2BE|nr:hypothetical protein [Acidithiobacillus ferrivorans]MBU2766836.1 hypothetical protein [Acidithiobacillus ferrivorans]MBU2849673.1 hypothetical protein [Acidithiobacillus ferrivorans]